MSVHGNAVVSLAQWSGEWAQDGEPDAVRELTGAVERLTDRQFVVARERLFAEQPATPDAVGHALGVTRERVRQIEAQARRRLLAVTGPGSGTAELLDELGALARPVASLDRLIAALPALGCTVPRIEVPLWRVLDRLADDLEVRDGWVAVPGLAEARSNIADLVDVLAPEHGAVELPAIEAVLALPHEELGRWLQWCGYQLLDSSVLTRTRFAGDHAAGILAAAGRPLRIDEMIARMGRPRVPRSVSAVLHADDRFVRTDRSTWALAAWDVEEYTTFRHQIGRTVDAAGGAMPLAELVPAMTSRFAVSPSRVLAAVSGADFELHEGVVRRGTGRAVPPKAPEETRRLYRLRNAWRFRLTVNAVHLRGSGFPLPSGVALAVGCEPGGARTLNSAHGPYTISWRGPQPVSGSIKRALAQLGAQAGDSVFLDFDPGGVFSVVPVQRAPGDAGPLRDALALVGGYDVTDPQAVIEALAAAAGLEFDAKPRRILSAYLHRGDHEVAALLEQAWVRPSHETAEAS